MTVTSDQLDALLGSLHDLRTALAATSLPLPTPSAAEATRTCAAAIGQLDDYVLPRLRELDAPLLAVVGGSTGSGKSTLVNSVVGRAVSSASAIRPTTRGPVLVHHPDDAAWFRGSRILPGLTRVTGDAERGADALPLGGPTTLELVADPAVPAGLALLDAPDIDSVVEVNRELAAQLLAAGDLWVFVTTAARYADAVPWDLLDTAADRQAAVAVVLDRVAPEHVEEVSADLGAMLTRRGLGGSPFFVVTEGATGPDGLLPAEQVASVRSWLVGLAEDAVTRHAVVRRTVDGAVAALVRAVPAVADAADEQDVAVARLHTAVADAYADAASAVDDAVRDGTLLRGEVLARWQDFVGTGAVIRSLESRVGRARDRFTAFLRGRPQPAEEVEAAIGSGLQAVLVDAAEQAAERAARAWRHDPAAVGLVDGLGSPTPGFVPLSAAMVRAWQGAVLDLVRSEGADRRLTARMLSFGVNGVAIALMVVVFASTAGLTGVEVGVAGGSAVVGQKVLEAVFGDQAVRRMAAAALADLRQRSDQLLATESDRFVARLTVLDHDDDTGSALRSAAEQVERARAGAR